jgi:hypothetical protein
MALTSTAFEERAVEQRSREENAGIKKVFHREQHKRH